MAEHDLALPAGSVVMTGALTDAIAVAPGDVVQVTIARLGSLSIRFV
jgi:2-oxo-3-hexenedioate decarboxylase